MRNQTWDKGKLVADVELARIDGVATAVDHLTRDSRQATSEEEEVLRQWERDDRRAKAKVRAIEAIKANADKTPWGRILYDLALALEIMEEQ